MLICGTNAKTDERVFWRDHEDQYNNHVSHKSNESLVESSWIFISESHHEIDFDLDKAKSSFVCAVWSGESRVGGKGLYERVETYWGSFLLLL